MAAMASSSFLTSMLTALWCLAWLRWVRGTDTVANDLLRDQDVADFADTEEFLAREQERRLDGLAPGLGERCGRNNQCEDGTQCTRANLASRCAPKDCFEDGLEDINNSTNFTAYAELIWEAAGLTEDEFLLAAKKAGSGRAFAETDEFKRFGRALLDNSEPLLALQDIQKDCIGSKQTTEDMWYLGFQLGAGLLLDGLLQFMFVTRVNVTGLYLRACLGAKAGGGAELAFLAGGATAAMNLTDMIGVSCWGDMNFGVIGTFGAALGIGFVTGLFQYEFTVGIGATCGIGTSLCYCAALFETLTF